MDRGCASNGGEKMRMKGKINAKDITAIVIGTVLFVASTNIQIPMESVQDTTLQPRIAILAFFSATFGLVVGAVIGFVGHAVSDAFFHGSIWWSWVIAEAFFAALIGMWAKKFAVSEGGFDAKEFVLFNMVQVCANAVAWIILAPLLDIVFYRESPSIVFEQGTWAFLGNVIIAGILGTILLAGYSFYQRSDINKNQ